MPLWNTKKILKELMKLLFEALIETRQNPESASTSQLLLAVSREARDAPSFSRWRGASYRETKQRCYIQVPF